MAKDRLVELDAKRDAILKKAAPLRKELDAFVKDTMPKERKLREKIKAAEEGLSEIDKERAALLRR